MRIYRHPKRVELCLEDNKLVNRLRRLEDLYYKYRKEEYDMYNEWEIMNCFVLSDNIMKLIKEYLENPIRSDKLGITTLEDEFQKDLQKELKVHYDIWCEQIALKGYASNSDLALPKMIYSLILRMETGFYYRELIELLLDEPRELRKELREELRKELDRYYNEHYKRKYEDEIQTLKKKIEQLELENQSYNSYYFLFTFFSIFVVIAILLITFE